MEDLEGYRKLRLELTNRKGSKNRVRDSVGVYDMYKLIRRNGWFNIGRPVKEEEFYAIVRGINRLIAEQIAKGQTIRFPERMGTLELRKHSCGAKLVDNKLKIIYPVDWAETIKLWYNDPEAKRRKTLLRRENPWAYKVLYLQGDATYDNKCFYQFALNTFIKKALCKNIREGKVDSLWRRFENKQQ